MKNLRPFIAIFVAMLVFACTAVEPEMPEQEEVPEIPDETPEIPEEVPEEVPEIPEDIREIPEEVPEIPDEGYVRVEDIPIEHWENRMQNLRSISPTHNLPDGIPQYPGSLLIEEHEADVPVGNLIGHLYLTLDSVEEVESFYSEYSYSNDFSVERDEFFDQEEENVLLNIMSDEIFFTLHIFRAYNEELEIFGTHTSAMFVE